MRFFRKGMLRDKLKYANFFIMYGLCVLMPIFLLTTSVLFLWRSAEFTSYEDIIKYQVNNNAIFGPGTVVDYFEYKLKLVKQLRPETLVLGSSRALGFQDKYFKSSFTNAGLAMRSLEEGKLFLQEMLQFHNPKRIIFTLDFWWFNEAVPLPSLTYKKFNKSLISSEKIFLPFKLLHDKKLTLTQFIKVFALGLRKNSLTYYENLGIMGIISSNGIRPDGSMLYSEFALGGREDLDPQFTHTADLIAKRYGNYEKGEHVSQERLAVFKEIIDLCRKHHIKVYALLPPVAPEVYNMLSNSDDYQYVNELPEQLHSLNIPVFDFHDATQIPANHCEFIDGYHSGDVTYLKMLLFMASHETHHDLAKIIKRNKALKTIALFDGQVIDRTEANYFPNQNEKDFLRLGCKKH